MTQRALVGEAGTRRLRAGFRAGAAAALCVMVLAGASPAWAAPPRAGRPAVSVRGFADFNYDWFAAKQSFSAVFGKSTGTFVGGGAQVVFRNGLYVEIGVSRFQETGQRAYVYGGQAYGLHIPLTARLVPIEFTGGYRFSLTPRLIVYGGGGLGTTQYTETSQFVSSSQNVSTRATSYQVRAGAEYRLARWVGVAGELQYRRVPGIFGKSGVSQSFGESNLGGTALDVKVIVGR